MVKCMLRLAARAYKSIAGHHQENLCVSANTGQRNHALARAASTIMQETECPGSNQVHASALAVNRQLSDWRTACTLNVEL